jgi:hypothetical protein
MGRKPLGDRLKKPTDYPQFAFRISQEDMDTLRTTIEKIYVAENAKRGPEVKRVSRSQIIVKALKNGLSALKKHGLEE